MIEYLLANLLGVFLAGGLAGAACSLLVAWPFERRRVRRLERAAFRACLAQFCPSRNNPNYREWYMDGAAVDAAIAAARDSKVDKGA